MINLLVFCIPNGYQSNAIGLEVPSNSDMYYIPLLKDPSEGRPLQLADQPLQSLLICSSRSALAGVPPEIDPKIVQGTPQGEEKAIEGRENHPRKCC